MKATSFVAVLLAFMLVTSCGGDDEEDLVGNWVEMADFNGTARAEAVSVTVDGTAYVMFGYDGDEDEYLNDIWKYDSAYDNWVELTAFPGNGRTEAVGFAANSKIYVGTGYDGDNKLDDFWQYDPSTDTWTEVSSFPGSARMAALAFSINDKGYVGTGYDEKNQKDFYEYDPATDTWTLIAGFGSKRSEAVAFVIDGEAYVCTGVDNAYEDDFAKFNPETGEWTSLRDIADTSDDSYDDEYVITRSNSVAFAVDGKGYVCTAGKGSASKTVWEYDPSTDLWEQKTDYEGYSRQGAIGFVVNGEGYVGLGKSGTLYYDDFYKFQPNAEYDDAD